MFKQWQIAGGLLAFVMTGACGGGDDPLVCPAGTVPSGGECIDAPDGGNGMDAGSSDAACVPTGDSDVPDPGFVDANCDGIDGDAASSIFVASDGDDAGAGTADDPLLTLAAAIARAQAETKSSVLVSVGNYDETVSVVLSDGISLYGGYDRAAGWSRSRAGRATVTGPSPVIAADSVTEPTTVALLRIEALDAAPGESSVAARLVDSTAVTFDDLEVVAGRGGDGAAAATPAAQPAAPDGMPGADGVADGICSASSGGAAVANPACECAGGGAGGMGDVGYGALGSAGEQTGGGGSCATGAAGGDNGGAPGASGKQGDPASDGATGASGAGGVEGTFTPDGYQPVAGGSGQPGTSGAGGGGGGGGGGRVPDPCITGGGGGGGGAGGCGGAASGGGAGGGASVALYLWASTPTLSRVVLRTGRGGTGGAGALGGDGGAGGAGGSGGKSKTVCISSSGEFCLEFDSSGAGGGGGAGGDGGAGGASGGGAGGPSIGIVLGNGSELSAASDSVVFELGAGGSGGAGGDGSNAGVDGAAGQTRVVGP